MRRQSQSRFFPLSFSLLDDSLVFATKALPCVWDNALLSRAKKHERERPRDDDDDPKRTRKPPPRCSSSSSSGVITRSSIVFSVLCGALFFSRQMDDFSSIGVVSRGMNETIQSKNKRRDQSGTPRRGVVKDVRHKERERERKTEKEAQSWLFLLLLTMMILHKQINKSAFY